MHPDPAREHVAGREIDRVRPEPYQTLQIADCDGPTVDRAGRQIDRARPRAHRVSNVWTASRAARSRYVARVRWSTTTASGPDEMRHWNTLFADSFRRVAAWFAEFPRWNIRI